MDYFLHLAPYFSAFRDMKRWWEWTEVAREVAEASPSAFDAVDRCSLYSQSGWGRGTFDERLAYLQQAHEIATTEMEPWHGVYTLTDLARLYSETGRLAEVEEAFLEAWEIAETSERPKLRAWTLREIGLYYTRTLNREGCVVVADRLVVTPPVDIGQGLKGAYDVASRGEVLACAERWAEALGTFREALAVHEATGNWVQGSEVRLEVARCLAHLGREEEVINEVAAVEVHLDALPPDVDRMYHHVAGEAARLRGDYPAAVEHLSAALEPTGEDVPSGWRLDFDAWLNLGQAFRMLERDDEAVQAFESARELAVNSHQPFWLWEVNRCGLVSESSTGPPSQVSELMSCLRGSK